MGTKRVSHLRMNSQNPVFLEFIEKKKIIIIIFNEGAQLATAVFSGALIN